MPPFESTTPGSHLARGTAVPVGERPVAVVGNPNSGKSTFFNAITGGNQPVGNWAGVTVEREVGHVTHRGVQMAVVDLPGVYSLTPSTKDEAVTRDHVMECSAHLFVNVVDASNLERNLYLTVQLLEMGVPVVVALNMLDTAAEHGVDIDARALAIELGCPVVAIGASKRQGLDTLLDAMAHALAPTGAPGPEVRPTSVAYPDPIATAINELAPQLAADPRRGPAARWLATRLLEGDSDIDALVAPQLVTRAGELRSAIEDATDEEVDILVADARYERIGEIASVVVRHRDRLSATRSEKIDRIALHPTFGIPVFLGVMYVMFMLTINVGSAFIDLFDALGSALFVQMPGGALRAIGVPEALIAVVEGIGGGLQTVVTFIPPVGIMFLCLRFLEDSGYMARAAFVTDRLMRALGLPGKAFVPMIVGFGCNVPAIMGARTLESERDRKLAVAMNPFMSCGARLPVYALFAAAFFPGSGQLVVFALYLIGILFAILTGLILKRTLLAGDLSPFIMELPPYHRPSARAVIRGAWQRLRTFVLGAGRFIVPVVAVLTILGSVGTDGTFHNENTDRSLLSGIGRTITPIFEPMGIQADNWPATVGIFTGIFAKEVVVGSLDSLYQQLGKEDAASAADGATDPAAPAAVEESPGVVETIGAGFAALPGALLDSLRSAADPLGISVGDVSSEEAAAAAQDVDQGTFGAMASRFDGGVGAFAYLLFILLYLPCVAATAAIFRETGLAWAMFVGAWTTGLAWGAAVVFYQGATFAEHPASSAMWIGVVLIAFVAVVTWMGRNPGGAHEPPAPPFCEVVGVTHPMAPSAASLAAASDAGALPCPAHVPRPAVAGPSMPVPVVASTATGAHDRQTRFGDLRAQPFVWRGPDVQARPIAPDPVADDGLERTAGSLPDPPARVPAPTPPAIRTQRPVPALPRQNTPFVRTGSPFVARFNDRTTPFARPTRPLSGEPDNVADETVSLPSHDEQAPRA